MSAKVVRFPGGRRKPPISAAPRHSGNVVQFADHCRARIVSNADTAVSAYFADDRESLGRGDVVLIRTAKGLTLAMVYSQSTDAAFTCMFQGRDAEIVSGPNTIVGRLVLVEDSDIED